MVRLAVVPAAPCQRELSAAVARQQLCQSLTSIRSCHPLPIPHAHPHIPSPPIPFPPARFSPVPFPPSPPSHAHHRPHWMLARTFFLMERSNEGAPSSPDWESLGVVKSLGAQSARVNVLPHLLPWLSSSAAASLRHGSCATLLDYHSTQTKFEGTNVHSSLCPPSPPSLVAATVFYPVSLISRLRQLTLVYVPDSKLPSPHRPPAALATAPALAPSTPPSPSGSAIVPLSPTPALVALEITLVRASPRRLPSRLTPSKPVEISLIRDIISFVSRRASTNAAKEGLLNASVQELADTDAPGLSDEDVKELNCMLKTWGVDADAKQLDTVVDEYGRTAVHVAARDGDVFVVQALLGLGMLVSVRCNNRSTPMHRGAWGGHVACMKLLQRYGANIRACTNKCCECTEKHLLLPPTVFLSALLCTVQLLLAYYSLPPTFSPSFIPSSHCRSARSPRCAPPVCHSHRDPTAQRSEAGQVGGSEVAGTAGNSPPGGGDQPLAGGAA
ncbi:unnamed protein product [Closterium sp. NIES-65]|nr:unnamed protein product [Closterium sp. NIES-65]